MRRLAPLLLVVAACSTAGSTTTSTTTGPVPSTEQPTTTRPTATTTPATAPTTTTSEPPEKQLYPHWKGSFDIGDGLQVEVYAPDVRSNHPIAVTVHGGAWYGGRPATMAPLAEWLAANGFVVFNAGYHTILQGGTFPSMVEDVACAVVYARDHALDYSTDDRRLALIGHSAGAHLSALVAFAPDTFGTRCPDPKVDVFVGLSGSYDTDSYPGFLDPFFGGSQSEVPDAWAAGNPFNLVSGIAPDLRVLLVHGEEDQLVPVAMSEDLAAAVEPYAAETRFKLVPGATHSDLVNPAFVGDLITQFVPAGQ